MPKDLDAVRWTSSGSSGCGAVDADLRQAALAAFDIPRERCRSYAETFTWRESARQFFNNIKAVHRVE